MAQGGDQPLAVAQRIAVTFRRLFTPASLLLAFCSIALPQHARSQGVVTLGPGRDTRSNGPMGTVTGRVLAGDTQHPLRLATVWLSADQSSLDALQQGSGNLRRGNSVNALTGSDGSFALLAAPGDYILTAGAPGYLSTRAQAMADIAAGAPQADVLARLVHVHVTADSISSAAVTLERGGVISGTLEWEDGSPVTGTHVMAVTPNGGSPMALGGGGFGAPAQGPDPMEVLRMLPWTPIDGSSQTDDRGHFRLTGVAPGDYLLRAQLNLPPAVPGSRGYIQNGVVVYAPGVFRLADAAPVSLHAGEERNDIRMVIDLRKLHTVSGRITSAQARDSINGGWIVLRDSTDRVLSRQGSIEADGSFVVNDVPAGTYSVGVTVLPQLAPGGHGIGGSPVVRQVYQPVTQTLTLSDTDVTGFNLTLTPRASASANNSGR